jgi:DmsE family decaheme c-type cytochrome
MGWKPSSAQSTPAASGTPGSWQASAKYVGSDVCKGCHEDAYTKFGPNPHASLIPEMGKKGPSAIEAHGCESCHGPGSAHVDGGGDKTKIINFKAMGPNEVSGVCQQCHQAGDHSNFQRSSHLTNGIGCTSCHSVHHAKERQALLQDGTPQLCYGCHTEQKAEFRRPYRHRVNEGLVRCTDCHNEHGSFLPRQLRTSAAQDQVCYTCHSDKRGPYVFEHVPVKTEGCTSCHTPHGSTNPRLLKVSQINTLCLQCHTLTIGPTPSEPPQGPAHNQAQKYQACIMCHAFIHGSNTSEVYFKP